MNQWKVTYINYRSEYVVTDFAMSLTDLAATLQHLEINETLEALISIEAPPTPVTIDPEDMK